MEPFYEGRTDAYQHLDIDIEAVDKKDIKILIGANVPEALIIRDTRRGSSNHPLAVHTPFGWCFFGPSMAKHVPRPIASESVNLALQSLWDEDDHSPSVYVQMVSDDSGKGQDSDRSLHEAVERFWHHENLGILPEKDVVMSQEDRDAVATMEKDTVKLKDGRYQVPMLWKKKKPKLPSNRKGALKRWMLLQKRLRRDSSTFQSMNQMIKGYLEVDPPYARKMTREEAEQSSSTTWYLPIHPVVNPNKPGKVRVVNDAAAVFENESLNSNLVSGPDLLSSLAGVLLRFRVGAVAIAADVEAMFHQVRVSPLKMLIHYASTGKKTSSLMIPRRHCKYAGAYLRGKKLTIMCQLRVKEDRS